MPVVAFEDYDQAYLDKHHRHAWRAPLCVCNEQVGTAMTVSLASADRHAAVPSEFHDGTPMREIYSKEEWPLLAFSFKSNIMNSYSAGLERYV